MLPEGEAKMQGRGKAVRSVASAACLGMMALLVGCSNFFVCQKASCPSSGGGGSSSNLAYVANATAGSNYTSGYDISGGTLTVATSAPYNLVNTPTAMVVSQNNKFLYAASTDVTIGLIKGWAIGTGGALTQLSSGNALATQATIGAMDVSPDGQWLIAANVIDGITQPTLTPYQLNTSNGTMAAGTALLYTAPAASAVYSLKVAPSGQYIAMAMSTGGVLIFPFNTSTGVIGAPNRISFTSSSVGAFDVAIDSNNYLYIASTGNIVTYAVSAAGVPANAAVGTTATASGGPFSIALDGTSYVYAAAQNGSSNLIYCFSNSKGVLTALSTATIAAPSTTTKLAVDSSKTYLLAAGYDTTAGLRMYSIGTGGNLSSLATAGTGTTTGVATAIALTH